MQKKPYPHRIEQSRNKHSRAVFREDTIVIRLARNLTKRERNEHAQELLDRMTKQLMREEGRRVHIHPFRELLDGKQEDAVVLGSGALYTISLRPGERLDARQMLHGWDVSVSPRTRRAQLHRFLWNLLANAEKERVAQSVESVNRETLRVRVGRVRFRFASSQWGSCSAGGTITLNAALLFVPPRLLRYVIIHELAHRLCANHSAHYWKIVEGVLPDFGALRSELHAYRLPVL